MRKLQRCQAVADPAVQKIALADADRQQTPDTRRTVNRDCADRVIDPDLVERNDREYNQHTTNRTDEYGQFGTTGKRFGCD